MVDRVTKEERSRIMSRIRSESAYEAELARVLRREMRVDRNRADLPGRPDLYLPGARLAVFVHGCFWHGCPRHYREPKSNVRFWREKVRRNRERDRRVQRALQRAGYRTMVVWTHLEIGDAAVRVLLRYLREKELDSCSGSTTGSS